MPELPEVEVTRAGIAPTLTGRILTGAVLRDRRLRWPVPAGLGERLRGQKLLAIDRRAKYLLFRFQTGTLIGHLGMSGSLRIVPASEPARPHDHVDLLFGDLALRLRDPRRFGALLWHEGADSAHALLAHLGPEPLGGQFDGATLHARLRGKRVAIKQAIMDARTVVGVGNIYASESLFLAGIRPTAAAGRLSRARCERLAEAIVTTLGAAIAAGGSSLRDFFNADGEPGYFQQTYRVYGRAGAPCRACGAPIRQIQQGQRSTFFCSHCQH